LYHCVIVFIIANYSILFGLQILLFIL